MRIVFVLVTLRDGLFDSNQVFLNRGQNLLIIVWYRVDENEMLVLSAYMFTSESFKDRRKSFMYTKRRGPKHEP